MQTLRYFTSVGSFPMPFNYFPNFSVEIELLVQVGEHLFLK